MGSYDCHVCGKVGCVLKCRICGRWVCGTHCKSDGTCVICWEKLGKKK
jgi:hypothetical protein